MGANPLDFIQGNWLFSCLRRFVAGLKTCVAPGVRARGCIERTVGRFGVQHCVFARPGMFLHSGLRAQGEALWRLALRVERGQGREVFPLPGFSRNVSTQAFLGVMLVSE